MDTKKPEIITMASLKGGVGKSTLTILFSYILKNLNKKVLLIDLDPQNSLTSYFKKYIYDIEKRNVYNMLRGASYFDQCINRINDYISIIPSHPVLRKFNLENIFDKESCLKNCLNKNIVRYSFDYILLDTSPSFDFILKNALSIGNYIVIPVQLKRWSIESLEILMSDDEIKNLNNKKNNICIIENQFIRNRNTQKDAESVLYKEYGEYIKGKIHYYNGITAFTNELLEPSPKEKYYKEVKNALENIIFT